MRVIENQWTSMNINGNVKRNYEIQWESYKINRNQWKSMNNHTKPLKTNGNPWKPINIIENPWKISEHQWKSLEINGIQITENLLKSGPWNWAVGIRGWGCNTGDHGLGIGGRRKWFPEGACWFLKVHESHRGDREMRDSRGSGAALWASSMLRN